MGSVSVACAMMTIMTSSSTLVGARRIVLFASTAKSVATRFLGNHVIVAVFADIVNTSLGSISAP